jgi:hypothetical protein
MMHRGYLFAPILAGAAFSVSGQRYMLDEFDLSPLAPTTAMAGTVEAVRETPLAPHPHAFRGDISEHRLQPDTVEEVVIRLDYGPIVTLAHDPALRVQPGQRVRVLCLPTSCSQ